MRASIALVTAVFTMLVAWSAAAQTCLRPQWTECVSFPNGGRHTGVSPAGKTVAIDVPPGSEICVITEWEVPGYFEQDKPWYQERQRMLDDRVRLGRICRGTAEERRANRVVDRRAAGGHDQRRETRRVDLDCAQRFSGRHSRGIDRAGQGHDERAPVEGF